MRTQKAPGVSNSKLRPYFRLQLPLWWKSPRLVGTLSPARFLSQRIMEKVPDNRHANQNQPASSADETSRCRARNKLTSGGSGILAQSLWKPDARHRKR